MRLLAVVAFACAVAAVPGCHHATPTPDTNTSGIAVNGDTVTGVAAIHLAPVESGCWQLTGATSSGESVAYQPIEIADSLKKEGLKVQFRGVVRHDRAGLCPGPFLQLLQIAPR